MGGRLPVLPSLRRPLALAGFLVIALTFFAGTYTQCACDLNPGTCTPGGGGGGGSLALQPCDGAPGYSGCISGLPGPVPTPVSYTWIEDLPPLGQTPTWTASFIDCEVFCLDLPFQWYGNLDALFTVNNPGTDNLDIQELDFEVVVPAGALSPWADNIHQLTSAGWSLQDTEDVYSLHQAFYVGAQSQRGLVCAMRPTPSGAHIAYMQGCEQFAGSGLGPIDGANAVAHLRAVLCPADSTCAGPAPGSVTYVDYAHKYL